MTPEQAKRLAELRAAKEAAEAQMLALRPHADVVAAARIALTDSQNALRSFEESLKSPVMVQRDNVVAAVERMINPRPAERDDGSTYYASWHFNGIGLVRLTCTGVGYHIFTEMPAIGIEIAQRYSTEVDAAQTICADLDTLGTLDRLRMGKR